MTSETSQAETPQPGRRAFLILHGWDNFRPPGHWQHELASALRARGERVVYPQLPDAAHPDVDAWRAATAAALAEAAGGDGGDGDGGDGCDSGDGDSARVTVLAHSLACLLWLGARPPEDAVERVLLVAPPAPAFIADEPEIAAFAALPLTAPGTPAQIAASDADPFCPEGALAVFGAPLGIPVTIIPGGGHLERTAGYGVWPSVLDWCLDPATPLTPNTTSGPELP
ncbi:hypothetical protein GCM10027406_26210 [Leifsonia lichenia]